MELKRRHRIARLQWVRARLRWRRNTWQSILFSDESKFNLKFSDGRVRIYRRRRERFADGCVKETDRFGGGGVMVWGGISHFGKTNLQIVAFVIVTKSWLQLYSRLFEHITSITFFSKITLDAIFHVLP
jgi:hypothetical protein